MAPDNNKMKGRNKMTSYSFTPPNLNEKEVTAEQQKVRLKDFFFDNFKDEDFESLDLANDRIVVTAVAPSKEASGLKVSSKSWNPTEAILFKVVKVPDGVELFEKTTRGKLIKGDYVLVIANAVDPLSSALTHFTVRPIAVAGRFKYEDLLVVE